MANWCQSRVGFSYLKRHGGTLLSPAVLAWDSPPHGGITQEELTDSDKWATYMVKAQIGKVWKTTSWDWPSTPPTVEEVCELFAAGRISIIMYMRDFKPGDDQLSSGAHKLFNMARYQLKELQNQTCIIGSAGQYIFKEDGQCLPLIGDFNTPCVFSRDEPEAFRKLHNIFDQWNEIGTSLSDYYLPF